VRAANLPGDVLFEHLLREDTGLLVISSALLPKGR
jgi:hypothetical protein